MSKSWDRFPSRQPIDVNNDVWFYENPGSIDVVNGGKVGRIPLRLLAKVVDRWRKHKAKRRAK